MRNPAASPSSLPASVMDAATDYLLGHQFHIWRRTDRLLAGLLLFEWAGAILLALYWSPRTWAGAVSEIHPHFWASVFLGGATVSLPIFFALARPGRSLTRHTIAAGQMLMSALLIHLGDGRVEMHFHIFGSLAFIAFYRDWRVLVTASLIVILDHLIRGLYLPESVYGVLYPTFWRSLEHAGWVAFEDLFLIGSCMQGVTEMKGIALNRALLEHTYADVERQVVQRTAELKNTQKDLVKTARTAGMAEIATSVLHNVGNVLNSVNVSATLVTDRIKRSELASLSQVSDLMAQHQQDLPDFLTRDDRGKMIPEFLADLAICLGEEQTQILAEVEDLNRGIEHIKRIVTAQQSMATTTQMCVQVKPAALIDTTIAMQGVADARGIQIRRQITESPDAMLDQHKVLQILINLLSNAQYAVMIRPAGQRCITMSVEPDGEKIRYQVRDNGVGIAAESLTRIFQHGFTTKKEGHGFGLHSAANAAREMGGSLSVASDGPGQGAVFTLEIPVQFVQEETPCQT